MNPRTAAALALAFLSGPALAGDPLVEAMPLDPNAPITLGIGKPNGEKLARRAQAELEPYLSKVMKRPVKVEILPDYDALSAALADGKVDIAWITPLAFVHAAQRRADVIAIAKAMRAGKLFYRAAFVVRPDSTARSLGDLAGKKVAYVSKSSSSGYLFPRALLSSQGKDPDRFFREAIFMGDYKLMRNGPPFGDGSWRLINLRNDPIESTDLSALEPERFQKMVAEAEAYHQRTGVVLPEVGYNPVRQLLVNNWKVLTRQLWFLLLQVALIVLGLPLLLGWWLRRRRPR